MARRGLQSLNGNGQVNQWARQRQISGRMQKWLPSFRNQTDQTVLAQAIAVASRDSPQNGGLGGITPQDIYYACGQLLRAVEQSNSDQHVFESIAELLEAEMQKDEDSNGYGLRRSRFVRAFRSLAAISQVGNSGLIGQALLSFLEDDNNILENYDEAALSALALAIYHMKAPQQWKLSLVQSIFEERQDVLDLLHRCIAVDADRLAMIGDSMFGGSMNGGWAPP